MRDYRETLGLISPAPIGRLKSDNARFEFIRELSRGEVPKIVEGQDRNGARIRLAVLGMHTASGGVAIDEVGTVLTIEEWCSLYSKNEDHGFERFVAKLREEQRNAWPTSGVEIERLRKRKNVWFPE